MEARLAWDYHYLYIAYEVFDSNLIGLTDDRVKGPSNNRRKAALSWAPEKKVDVAEFFVSLDSTRFLWELQHNAENQLNDVFLNVLEPGSPVYRSSLNFSGLIMNEQEYVKDDGWITVQTAVKLKPGADGRLSTVNQEDDTDTGYVAEMRFPWKGLGAPVVAGKDAEKKGLPPDGWDMAGRELAILAVILNGDAGPNYSHNCKQLPKKGMFATGVALFPRYTLMSTGK